MFAIGFLHAQDNDKDSSSDKLTFEKGTSLVNVGFFVNDRNTEAELPSQTQEDNRFGIGINSSYGYAISDDLFLGLGFGYSSNKREVDVTGNPTQEFKNITFRIFPYVRYYKGIGKNLAFFVQGETEYSRNTIEFDGVDTVETDGFSVGVRPGLTYMIRKCLALETTIGAVGYTSSSSKNLQNNDDSDLRGFNFSLNSSDLIFGLSYYF
jgi:hypothetical protein